MPVCLFKSGKAVHGPEVATFINETDNNSALRNDAAVMASVVMSLLLST